MEEILKHIDNIFKDADEVERKIDDDFTAFKAKLDSIVYGTKESHPPTPQQKRKVKRLSMIVDDDETDNSQPEMIVSQTTETIIKTESVELNASSRPGRAAKLKVGSFKEPPLSGKLRRPSQADDTLSTTKLFSEKSKDSKTNDTVESNDKQNNNPTKRSFEDETIMDNNNKESSIESSKKVDESLLLVPTVDLQIVELSDNESEKLMPPPVDIPKKKTTRKEKQSEAKSEQSTRSSRLRIKQEKLSIDLASLDKCKESQASEINGEKIKEEDIKIEKEISESGPKRRGRKPKQFKCMPIKEELPKDESEMENASKLEEPNHINSKDTAKPSSMTSVYEDAISESAAKPSEKANSNSIPNGDVVAEENCGPTNEIPADATFVSAKDVPICETNATFVTSVCPQKTFVMEKNTLDVDIASATSNNELNQTQVFSNNKAVSPVDTTFSINNETFKTQSNVPNSNEPANLLRSSIMTEEDSSEEIMPPPTKTVVPLLPSKQNQKKELFNPCIQSPVKKKVEAFEKHASAMASPAAIRQTRMNAKLKENKDPEHPVKHITPLLKRDIGKSQTPTQSNITPNLGIQINKGLANSTSKLAQIQKTAKPYTGTISKTQSLSRQNSVEDIKKTTYTTKLQLQADEKKKKREQKQQQAQMTRDAIVKEKVERTKRIAQEREMRRKVQEMEMKKQLESINKNIKTMEDKQDAQKKLQKKQDEMAEAGRKEREMLENMKIQKAKEELQAKLLENQRLHLEKKMAKKGKDAFKYDFDLLNSDDSTDDEEKPSSRKPSPPAWSKSTMRNMLIERQAQLATKLIDAFFSVQPMTPDLREIFPAIDPRYLKRNSSMYWNTPPRYSQLPKY